MKSTQFVVARFPLCLLGLLGLSVSPVQAVPSALSFVAITPCRAVDTRIAASGTFGAPGLSAGAARSFSIWQSPNCSGIPSSVQSYAVNFTVVPTQGTLGYLSAWPTGSTQPVVSTLNSPDGKVVANGAIIPAGTAGAISVFATNDTQLIIDVNGYYVN